MMEDAVQSSSNINLAALLFLAVMSLVMLQGTRQAAVMALLAITAFLPLGQQILVFGLHFQFFRILIIIGFIRVISRGENLGFRWNRLDKLFTAWAVVGAVCGGLRDPDAIMGVNCLGGAFNALGTYFLVRILTKNPTEALEHLSFLALAAVIVATAMLWEFATHRNLLSVFGGVPEYVGVRDGRFRCQGPFRHPILAGTFAATLLPLLAGMWLRGGSRKWLAILAMVACVFVSGIASASSGALLTCMTAVLGIALWPMRARMRLIQRGMVLVIAGLALVMNAPVWYIIAKISDRVGGTGWHRAYLIDQAVNHFGEWCFIGTSVTKHWAPAGQVLTVDPKNMDITNHYIVQGVHGGILGLGLFLAIIATCFRVIGSTVRTAGESPLDRKVLWAFGVSLACHCVSFVSISYFDQNEVFWFWLLAVFATVVDWQRRASALGRRARPLAHAAASSEEFRTCVEGRRLVASGL